VSLDATALSHLGVELNLGFGALVFFYEPVREDTEKAIVVIENHILRLSDSIDTLYNTSALFSICKNYRQLMKKIRVLDVEKFVWNGIFVKAMFVLCGFISFLIMIVSALEGNNVNDIIFFLSVVLDIPPLIFVIAAFFIALQHAVYVSPLIGEIQEAIFSNYINRGMELRSSTGLHSTVPDTPSSHSEIG
jgi:hypothetical protein